MIRKANSYGENLSVKTTSGCLGTRFKTNRDGDAWLSILTALLTVYPVGEGADAGREGSKGNIVVVPLAEQGHHVSELAVADHTGISCA